MGDSIQVDFGALSGLAGDIDTRASNIQGHLDDLRGQIAQLKTTWQGSANEGFEQTQDQWNKAADDLRQVLAQIASAVHAANDAYTQTEHSNAARWS